MRYMIHDSVLGFIVKDTDKGEQCQYRGDRRASMALRNGVGNFEYETLHREVLVHVPEVELREQVRILREALQKAHSGLDSAACYFDNQDSPSVVHVVDEALSEARAALEATKEGA